MKHLARATLALALLSAVILGACSEGPVGIFESLSLETPIDNGTEAFASQTPNFVVRFGSDYYAGVGALWRRSVTGETWSKVAGTPTGLYAVSAASDGTSSLWVLFTDGDTSMVKLWDGSIWSDVVTDGISTMAPDSLFFLNSTVFLSAGATDTAADPDVTSANIHSGANFATAAFGLAPSGGRVKALVHDGATFYAAHADDVHTGDATTGGGLAASVTPGVGTVTGLLARGAADVVATGSSGSVAVWNGSAWTAHVIDSTAYLSDLVEVPADGGGTVVLVATRSFGAKGAKGYFEVDPSTWTVVDDRGLVSTLTNFQTTLEETSITKLYYDSVGTRLFALTGGDGLWSNAWKGTAWSGWNRE